MKLNDYRNGHSAEVRMRLMLNGWSLPVAQLGPDFLILHEAIEHPPAKAEMSLIVDGHEERWVIRLPKGLPAGDRIIPISAA
ncbi:MAG TPA: hypothetical protein VK633_00335 [Verrucomicrobiae bacterium]|nr:hypothetical protein [Verrucomicrobiae bacterium]